MNATPRRGTVAAPRGTQPGSSVGRALAAAPERLTLALVSLAVACGITVSLGAFRPVTTLPLAAVLTAVGWIFGPEGPRDGRSAMGGGIAVAGAGVWFVSNLPQAAEYLIVRRDPGFLTLSALWLTDHPSTDMPTGGSVAAANQLSNVLADAPEAWNLHGDVIQPQGAKLLPALAAVGGWVNGMSGVLAANLVIGAVGLLATYVLARRMMGPIAALVPALGLALTVSHIWLSRAAYTEPITMVLLLAAITWAWQGVEERRVLPLIAAGVASGATCLARVDGPLFAMGVAMGVATALAASRVASLRWRATALLAFAVSQAALVAVGHFSIWRWSHAYVARLGSESRDLEIVYGLVVGSIAFAGVVALVRDGRLARRGRTPLARSGAGGGFARRARPYLPHALAGTTLAILLGLASRPLWMTGHSGPDDFQVKVVAFWQQAESLPIDGTRTYSENSITWVSYYLTWPVVALGFVGLAIAAWRLGRGRAPWAVLLGGLLVPSLLYVVRPAIMPDQVWAIRRLTPSLVVGLLILAAVAWQELVALWRRRGYHHDGWPRVASIAIAALIAASPLAGWTRISISDGLSVRFTSALFGREQAGAREQIDTLCSYLDGRPVVLVGTSSHFGTVRAACGSPVLLVFNSLKPDAVVTMAEAFGERPVVITRTVEDVPWTEVPGSPTFSSTVYYAGSSVAGLPVERSAQNFDWYVGHALADGTVEFVPGE